MIFINDNDYSANHCGKNEYWEVLGEPCVRSPEDPRPKCLFNESKPACVCDTGFKRHPKTNECVPISKTGLHSRFDFRK